jgi:hypothetical protein
VQWNPLEEKWIAMVKIFQDGKRARGYAESTDFLHWSDTYYLGAADARDEPGDEMYAIDVFPYESLLFGQLRMYHTATDKVDIQLMTSRNGKQWNRDIRTPFIPCAEEKGSWDFANNAAAESPPIRRGDELLLYYSGRSTLHDEVPNTGAIGVGTLRVGWLLLHGRRLRRRCAGHEAPAPHRRHPLPQRGRPGRHDPGRNT